MAGQSRGIQRGSRELPPSGCVKQPGDLFDLAKGLAPHWPLISNAVLCVVRESRTCQFVRTGSIGAQARSRTDSVRRARGINRTVSRFCGLPLLHVNAVRRSWKGAPPARPGSGPGLRGCSAGVSCRPGREQAPCHLRRATARGGQLGRRSDHHADARAAAVGQCAGRHRQPPERGSAAHRVGYAGDRQRARHRRSSDSKKNARKMKRTKSRSSEFALCLRADMANGSFEAPN